MRRFEQVCRLNLALHNLGLSRRFGKFNHLYHSSLRVLLKLKYFAFLLLKLRPIS